MSPSALLEQTRVRGGAGGNSAARTNMWISLRDFKSGSEKKREENTEGERINSAIWVTNVCKSLGG